MTKLLAIFILTISLAGCRTPSYCQSLCERISTWMEACDNTYANMNYSDCYDHYRAANYSRSQNPFIKECWHKLYTWTVASGEQIDCSKPPPRYNDREAERL